MITEAELRREAATAGFRPESLEKVLRLSELLEGLRQHPFLKSRLVLRGGTALNLFEFDLPRLSVDLDLNYVGARETEFLDALNDGGRIRPELLTDDAELRERIAGHPGLHWKALNVRRRTGDEHDGPDSPSY